MKIEGKKEIAIAGSEGYKDYYKNKTSEYSNCSTMKASVEWDELLTPREGKMGG